LYTKDDVTIEHHVADGFTLYLLKDGYLTHTRYIFYSVEEAMEMFLQQANEGYNVKE
jgi:hypothetical protein